ncbi:hypothetical protein BC835DRAFT_501295 [Cytidiella melzeri]|nr:hypothetical protein BC835DRAFT_501295 [Cytidiella melzeri]
MYETLLHPQYVESIARPPPISVAAATLKRLEIRKEEKRLRQIAQAHRGKRKRTTTDNDDDEGPEEEADPAASSSFAHSKKAKTTRENDKKEGGDVKMLLSATTSSEEPMAVIAPSQPSSAAQPAQGLSRRPTPEDVDESDRVNISVSKAFPEVRGHTSYLTFAVFFPPSMTSGASEAKVSTAPAQPQPSTSMDGIGSA